MRHIDCPRSTHPTRTRTLGPPLPLGLLSFVVAVSRYFRERTTRLCILKINRSLVQIDATSFCTSPCILASPATSRRQAVPETTTEVHQIYLMLRQIHPKSTRYKTRPMHCAAPPPRPLPNTLGERIPHDYFPPPRTACSMLSLVCSTNSGTTSRSLFTDPMIATSFSSNGLIAPV